MQAIIFWKTWPQPQRFSFLLLLLLFGGACFMFPFAYYLGLDLTIGWQLDYFLDNIKHQISEIHAGMFDLPIEGEMFVMRGQYESKPLQIAYGAYIAYGIGLAISIPFFLSVLSTLRSLWFALGMTVFIFFLSYCSFGYVWKLGGYAQGFLILCLLLYVLPAFYFQSFAKNISFGWRCFSFFLVTILLGTLLITQSEVETPLLYLIAYGSVVPVWLTVLFILISAWDLPQTFFYWIVRSNPQGGTSNLIHLSVITLFYLLNLLLVYLNISGDLSIDIYYIDAFWLFWLATLAGIWSKGKENILPFPVFTSPYQSAFLYVGLATLSLGTVSFYHATANDSMLDLFHDLIVYSYLAFGIIFYLYVLANFTQLMREKMDVSGIIYEGTLFPIHLASYFGIAGVMVLFISNQQIIYYQGRAGYYIGLGDVYVYEEDFSVAKAYYEERVLVNDYLSHRGNYTMSTLARLDPSIEDELIYLKNAVRRRPSSYAYARLGNLLQAEERKYDALFSLREGTGHFPNSLPIHNNLGLFYQGTGVADSVFYYLEKAETLSGSNPVAQNNLWAYLAENPVAGTNLQDLPPIKNTSQNLNGRVNQLALYNSYQQSLSFEEPLQENLSNEANESYFAYTYNYALNRLGQLDSMALQQLTHYDQIDTLGAYYSKLRFAEACLLYYGGQTREGIQRLAALPRLEYDSYYNTILALWLLEQKAFSKSVAYLDKAIQLGNELAYYYKAIALSEASNFEEAIPLWLSIYQNEAGDPELIRQAGRVLRVLQDSTELADEMDGYNFIHYRKNLLSASVLEGVFQAIPPSDFKIKAAAEMIDYYLEKNELVAAETIYQDLAEAKTDDPHVASQWNFAKLQLWLAEANYRQMLENINQMPLLGIHQHQKPYFLAVAYEKLGQKEQAREHYAQALAAAPYQKAVILAAANFYQTQEKNTEKAYQVLVQGVRDNAESVDLLQAYVFAALEMGLDFYAKDALEKLQVLMEPSKFQDFQRRYEKEVGSEN